MFISNILPRRTWRYSNNTDAMERTRTRLNRGLRTYLLQNNSYAIAHPDFDDSYSVLYDDDGVNLSFIGNKGNNKITELRTILQRESQNS